MDTSAWRAGLLSANCRVHLIPGTYQGQRAAHQAGSIWRMHVMPEVGNWLTGLSSWALRCTLVRCTALPLGRWALRCTALPLGRCRSHILLG